MNNIKKVTLMTCKKRYAVVIYYYKKYELVFLPEEHTPTVLTYLEGGRGSKKAGEQVYTACAAILKKEKKC
jgi:hypothetical protein